MKLRRPRWKLIIATAITTALFLCGCSTLSLTVLRGDRTVELWLGNSVLYIQTTSSYRIITPNSNIAIGIGPCPEFRACSRLNTSIGLGDTDFSIMQCNR